MSGLMNVGGLISGLQTDSILMQLEQLARVPIARMQNQKIQLQAKYDAWGKVNSFVTAFKNQGLGLTNLAQRMTITATSSDSAVAVTTSSSAVPGNYTIKVNSLSTYDQQTSSRTYSDTDTTTVGDGTLSLTINGKTTDISTNNLTLNGLRDAINGSDSGVSASIVSNGAATPEYRLILTSKTQGSQGKITVGGDLAGWDAGSVQHMVIGDDTKLTIGDSAGGGATFDVSRVGNTLTDVIPGVTLALSDSSRGKTVNINVNSSTNGIKNAISEFVNMVNQFKTFLNEQNTFDEKSKTSGTLFGDFRLNLLYGDLASLVTNPVSGLPAEMRSLNQIGIKTDNTGMLKIDSETLDAALRDRLQDVYKLFGATAAATNNAVSYVSSTTDTKSASAGYAVEITQPAVQSKWSNGVELPDILGQDETLTINDVEIKLTQNMTAAQIIAEINKSASKTDVVAALTGAEGVGAGNYLTLTRGTYGASATVKVQSSLDKAAENGSGIGTTLLMEWAPGEGNTGVRGQDVAGTINGATATGIGQMLTSAEGDSKGLQLKITADIAGSFGTVSFTNGIGALIAQFMSAQGDSETSGVKAAQNSITSQMTALDEHIGRVDESATRETERLRKQFNAMEVALSKLQNQANQLSSQIASMQNNTVAR